MGTTAGSMRGEEQVPKILGADVELGNFVLGLENPEGSGFEASRRLLREISGVSGRSTDAATCSSASQLVVWRGSSGQPGIWIRKAENDGSSRTSEDPRDHDCDETSVFHVDAPGVTTLRPRRKLPKLPNHWPTG